MHPLSAAQLLDVWEQGAAEHPVRRALLLLVAACPGTSPDDLTRLCVGERDGRLLKLRAWTFGPRLVALAACPQCGESLELNFDVADIRAAGSAEPAGEMTLSVTDYVVRFRPPDSQDLLAAAGQTDLGAARRLLFKRCVLAAWQGEAETSPERLPAQVVDAVAARLAQADPQADVQLALACPACGREWLAAFDIVSFFWTEIDAWARRLLREVHTLAAAYGWREADVLSLSPRRRQIYLEMVGG